MSHPLQGSTIETVDEVRQEFADSRKKLQDYADTIVSLHGELRTLRNGICKSCKRKFIPANLVSSQAAEPAVDSSALVKSSRAPAKSKFSWRRLLNVAAPDHIPSRSTLSTSEIPRSSQTLPAHMLSTPTYIPSPSPVVTTRDRSETMLTSNPASSEVTPNAVPSVPRWFAERDETANATLNVMYVRAFSHKGRIQSVRFSADGKYLAAVGTLHHENGSIFIYDVETGDEICELLEYASQYSSVEKPGIICVCFSPNGRYLVVGDMAYRVIVWDIPKKGIRNEFKGHKSSVESVEFSPNGRLVVSASFGGTVFIWNMRDGSAKLFINTTHWCYSTRFSPNGQFAAMGSSDGLVRIWNVRTGHLVRRWTGHKSTVRDVAFTSDAKELVTGGNDGFVKCWDLSSSETVQSGGDPISTMILECEGHGSAVNAVAVSPDAQWIASGLDNGRTIIWDTHSAMRQCTLIGHAAEVRSVDFSPVGGYLALGSRDGHITLWRYTTV